MAMMGNSAPPPVAPGTVPKGVKTYTPASSPQQAAPPPQQAAAPPPAPPPQQAAPPPPAAAPMAPPPAAPAPKPAAAPAAQAPGLGQMFAGAVSPHMNPQAAMKARFPQGFGGGFKFF